ncbi:hypothetical protein PR202_gb07673 [Eleusine coracana subsp. coracana]|uniref:Calcium uniporter protein n=1 Tax=Eleusine coracana subsp. coracana TaxID=191504 RepID=A0AAV5ECU5_ELECO|nr:hypothetical protein PR202_gb07673 [Eleusine coracana subsp. coracana]
MGTWRRQFCHGQLPTYLPSPSRKNLAHQSARQLRQFLGRSLSVVCCQLSSNLRQARKSLGTKPHQAARQGAALRLHPTLLPSEEHHPQHLGIRDDDLIKKIGRLDAAFQAGLRDDDLIKKIGRLDAAGGLTAKDLFTMGDKYAAGNSALFQV